MVGGKVFVRGDRLSPAVGQRPEGVGPIKGKLCQCLSCHLLRLVGQTAVEGGECLRRPVGLQLPRCDQMRRVEGGSGWPVKQRRQGCNRRGSLPGICLCLRC